MKIVIDQFTAILDFYELWKEELVEYEGEMVVGDTTFTGYHLHKEDPVPEGHRKITFSSSAPKVIELNLFYGVTSKGNQDKYKKKSRKNTDPMQKAREAFEKDSKEEILGQLVDLTIDDSKDVFFPLFPPIVTEKEIEEHLSTFSPAPIPKRYQKKEEVEEDWKVTALRYVDSMRESYINLLELALANKESIPHEEHLRLLSSPLAIQLTQLENIFKESV